MISELVTELYTALGTGDRSTVERLIGDDFVAEFSAGLGAPIGGLHRGSDAIDSGWWEIGRQYAVRAVPEEFIPTADGRLLVMGHYAGRSRAYPDSATFNAAFAHLWCAAGDELTSLTQITDTAAWLAGPTARPFPERKD